MDFEELFEGLFFLIGFSLLWPILLAGVIVAVVMVNRNRAHANPEAAATARENLTSQLYLLLAIPLFALALSAINREFGDPLSWRLITLVTALAAFAAGYGLKATMPMVSGVVTLLVWWIAQLADWIEQGETAGAAGVVGFLFFCLALLVVGHAHEGDDRRRRPSLLYIGSGLTILTAVLFTFSTQSGIRLLEGATKGKAVFASFPLAASLLGLAVLIIIGSVVNLMLKRMLPTETGGVIALVVLAVVYGLLPEQHLFIADRYGWSSDLNVAGAWWAFLLNLAVLLELVSVVLSGWLRHEHWRINLGAIFLFLFIIVKYFDWFFKFLDKSVFFIGAGLLLFGLGFALEHGRRRMLQRLNQSPATVIPSPIEGPPAV